MEKTYYQILGVSEDATDKEIKEKYKELVVRYHPDKVKSKSKYMQNKFNEITEAYATLSDDYKRDVYDDELDKERNGDFNTRFGQNTNGWAGNEGNQQFTDAMKILDSVFKNNPFFANNGSNGFFTNNSGGDNNGNSSNPFDQPFFKDPQKFMADAMKNGNNGNNGGNCSTSFSTSTTQNDEEEDYHDENEDSEQLLSSDYEYNDDDFDLDSDGDDTFGNMDQEEYYKSRCGKKD